MFLVLPLILIYVSSNSWIDLINSAGTLRSALPSCFTSTSFSY